jgi:hypothetical protein
MFALPSKADLTKNCCHVRQVPIAGILGKPPAQSFFYLSIRAKMTLFGGFFP